MPTNTSYIKLRNEILALNESAKQYCLCKAIDGGCCKPNLKMLPEDQEVIMEAVASGEIDAATLQRARRRADDEQVNRCPFLGDQGECTIYPYRPVVCIQHGNGGLPKDKETTMRAIRNPGKKTIKISEIEKFSCDACAEQINHNDRIPLSVVGKSVSILVTIQEGERHYGHRRMNQFLREAFPETTQSATAQDE